jgi:predicted nucleotidyltransferase
MLLVQDVKVEIDKIIKEINQFTNANQIYLFGSYAYGKPNEDSDIDLCVVTADNEVRKIDVIRRIRKAILNVATMPVDIIVYYKEEFLERAKLDCTMEHKIAFEGIKIYEK